MIFILSNMSLRIFTYYTCYSSNDFAAQEGFRPLDTSSENISMRETSTDFNHDAISTSTSSTPVTRSDKSTHTHASTQTDEIAQNRLDKSTENMDNTLSKSKKTRKCSLCTMEFEFQCRLNAHVREKHMGINYPCSVCGKTFKTVTGLRIHSKNHEGKYTHVCDCCGKGFNYKSEMIAHQNRIKNSKPFECKSCKRGFFTASNRNAHSRMCTAAMDYECNICFAKFKCRRYLTRHERIHAGLRFICICNREFKHKSSLIRHQKKAGHFE